MMEKVYVAHVGNDGQFWREAGEVERLTGGVVIHGRPAGLPPPIRPTSCEGLAAAAE